MTTRSDFRSAYGFVRHMMRWKDPNAADHVPSPLYAACLQVWSQRRPECAFVGGQRYAADTPREGFTRQTSIRVALRAVRHRNSVRRYHLPDAAALLRSPIPG